MLALESWNVDFCSYRGLGKRYGDHAVQVVALAFEECMVFDMQDDIEITGRTSEGTGFAQAAESDPGAVFHAGGNFSVDSFLAEYSAFALAFWTGIGDDAARSLACGASASNAEESLLISDLTSSRTGSASHRRFAWGCTRAFAFFTSLVAADCDFRLGAEEG